MGRANIRLDPVRPMTSATHAVDPTSLTNKNLIFDIGMHIGQDTEYYLKKGFYVVAVEANPHLAAKARERFDAHVQNGRLIIINKGISGENYSEIPFFVNNTDSAWSSFIESIGARGGSYEKITIDVVSFPDILEKYGCPYYLKIDIEGLDFEVIKSLRRTQARPTYISAENGEETMIRELGDLGYKSFKFINQASIEGRQSTTPSKEGLEVKHIFEHGASGEFGEDTPGEWLSMNQVIEISNKYWSNPSRDENVDGWFDVHARIF